jgi:hypothetical protein
MQNSTARACDKKATGLPCHASARPLLCLATGEWICSRCCTCGTSSANQKSGDENRGGARRARYTRRPGAEVAMRGLAVEAEWAPARKTPPSLAAVAGSSGSPSASVGCCVGRAFRSILPRASCVARRPRSVVREIAGGVALATHHEERRPGLAGSRRGSGEGRKKEPRRSGADR